MKSTIKKSLFTAAVLFSALLLVSCGRVRRTNSFDELFNEVRGIKYGKRDSFLLTGDNYVDCDLGFFDHVEFPNEGFTASLADGELLICSNEGFSYYYDPKTKALTGDNSFKYLYEGFLKRYFTEDELGDFTFERTPY